MSTRRPRSAFVALVALGCTVAVGSVTADVVLAGPAALPKGKGLPAPKAGPKTLPGPVLPKAVSSILLKQEWTVELKSAVQHFAGGEGFVRFAYAGAKPASHLRARVSRFDANRRTQTWIVPLTSNTNPMANLPRDLWAALSALGGTYAVALVDVGGGKQVSNEVPLLSAAVGTPEIRSPRSTSPGLWRYFEQLDAPPRSGVKIDVSVDGLHYAPSNDLVLRWEFDHVPANVAVVNGATPQLTTLKGDVSPSQATRWSAAGIEFSFRIPEALLPAIPGPGQEMSRIVQDRLLLHSKLRVSIFDAKKGRVVSGPVAAPGWNRFPTEKKPKTDLDGDGSHGVEYGGDDCDDSDPRVSPDITEICDPDGLDEDCDHTTIGGSNGDADGDGFVAWRCCNWNGGSQLCGTDCNDTNAQINPHAQDVCNGIDDDCDGQIDEGLLNCASTSSPG